MSQAPGSETKPSPATGPAVAPSTPVSKPGASTSPAPSTPVAATGTPAATTPSSEAATTPSSSNLSLRERLAATKAAAYSPSSGSPASIHAAASAAPYSPKQPAAEPHSQQVYMVYPTGYPPVYYAPYSHHQTMNPTMNPSINPAMSHPYYQGSAPGGMSHVQHHPRGGAVGAPGHLAYPPQYATQPHHMHHQQAAHHQHQPIQHQPQQQLHHQQPSAASAAQVPAVDAPAPSTTAAGSVDASKTASPAASAKPDAKDTASASANNATANNASLAPPADSRSALTSSGETSLQPPIKKGAKAASAATTAASAPSKDATSSPNGSSAASTADKPKETAKTENNATSNKTETAKTTTSATPNGFAAVAAMPKPESPKPVTAASIVASGSPSTHAASDAKATSAAKPVESKPTAADIVRSSPKPAAATTPATAAPAAKVESKISIADIDVNFEAEEPAPKKTSASTAPTAASTASPTPAKPTAASIVANSQAKTSAEVKAPVSESPKTEAKSTAAKSASESAAATSEASKNVEKVSEKPSTPATTTTAAAEKTSEKNGETSAAAALAVPSTPEPAARATSPAAGAAPVPYKVTVEDQQAAKKNDDTALPPGIRVYSADMLMSFASLAKGVTPPPSLQQALDRARVNSPARGPGGKGPGGAAGGKRGNRTDKIKGPPPTAVRPQSLDPTSIEAKARTFRGILNKITPEMFDKLVAKLLQVPVENPETLAALVDIIANVAVRELKFCGMYATLCSQIAMSFKFERVDDDGTKYPITFRSIILNKCQSLFSERTAVQPIPADVTDPEQRQEWEIRENKKRQHLLGLVKFIAELANQSVLAMSIIPQILDILWKAQLGYEDLELYTIMLSTSGKHLPTAKAAVQKCRDWIKAYAEREKDQQDSEGTRIRYLMQDTIDLADNDWVPRSASSAAQGPKTLDEIREDIAKREKQLETELRNMKIRGGGPVSGGRLAQPVPTKAAGRGPFSVMQRDAPRTPSSPSQGGRGKPGFASQASGSGSKDSAGAFSPARGSSSNANATPAAGLTSPHTLSNAFDSLMDSKEFDPNFLTNSTSSAPREEDFEENTGSGRRGKDSGAENEEMNTEALDTALEEFLDSAIPEDAVETIADGPAVEESCKYFISQLLLKVFDTTPDKKRDDWALNFLTLFVKDADFGLTDTDRTVVPGLTATIEQLDNIDSPLAPGRMGAIMGECLNRKVLQPNGINKILAPLAGGENPRRATQIIVSMWKRVNPADVALIVKQSNFSISNWKIPESELPESMTQSMETADGLLKKGTDILDVVVWAKKAGSPALRDVKFIEKAVTRLSDDARTAAAAKQPLDDAKYGPVVSSLLSSANNSIFQQVATMLVNNFAAKPAQGIALFTLFTNNGLAKKTISDTAEKKGDNYIFDPGFTTWAYSGTAASSAASSSKGGKGGKGKKKK